MSYASAKPQVKRAYSDPDYPELLPLPVRPQSSYEPAPEAKQSRPFEPEIVEAMARELKIDLQDDRELQWVIRDVLLALDEEGFHMRVHGTDIRYQDKKDNVLAEHPIVNAHKIMVRQLKAMRADLKMKMLDPNFVIRQKVYLAIMGEKDVRGVTTPQMIQELMDKLDVNPLDEPYLIHRIKTTVEDCYFRMRKIGSYKVTIENCIDVETLRVNLELDRVGFQKKISPSGLLYCVECQSSLADVISSGCHDVFCNACAVEMHSTGNRQDTPLVFFEQSVCSECNSKASLVRCQDCCDLFCYGCFKAAHARGKRQKHCVSLPQRTFCSECDEREAAYICIETEDVMCTKCAGRMHRSGARQNHTLFGLRKAAYNKKLFADNLDRLMGIMQKNLERSYSLRPWFVFYNTALSPYWYNFQTNHKVPANPYDLVNPPQDDDEEGLIPASMDDQILQALPGASMLRETHAAKFAAQGASFDVPPPIHIKFISPIA